MRTRTLRSLGELLNDVFWSRTIGIAHAEVDDVFATLPRCSFQFPDDIEDIRRQPADSAEFAHIARVPDTRISEERTNDQGPTDLRPPSAGFLIEQGGHRGHRVFLRFE